MAANPHWIAVSSSSLVVMPMWGGSLIWQGPLILYSSRVCVCAVYCLLMFFNRYSLLPFNFVLQAILVFLCAMPCQTNNSLQSATFNTENPGIASGTPPIKDPASLQPNENSVVVSSNDASNPSSVAATSMLSVEAAAAIAQAVQLAFAAKKACI